MSILDGLNENQVKAVKHIDGPCLVIAGAGSGKTKVLTTRIAYLIEQGIKPWNILAITFTNKAAKEMKDRLSMLISQEAGFVGTFHSLGLKIIRENHDVLNLTNNFTILDSEDVLSIIKKLLKEKNYDSKEYSPSYIRNRISFIKNENLSRGEIDKFFNTQAEKVASEIYDAYEELLRKNNSVDFDDLLRLPVKLFDEHKDILEKYQEKFKYILVDEYQDTNEVQYQFNKKLSSKYKNIFVVGDPNQSIYAFRNANFKNILNFENDFPNTEVIALDQNYRSTNYILDTANSIIKNNKERKELNLKGNIGEGIKTKYIRTYDDKNEISVVIEEIKDLLCYLKLISNLNDDVALRRIINVPKRGIGQTSIDKLEKEARDNHISMFEAITDKKQLIFKDLILELKKQSNELSLTELIDLVLEKSGLKLELEQDKSLESELRLDNLMEFKSITAAFEEQTGSVNLEDFLSEVSLVADVSEHKSDGNEVTLMTIHSAKGLEFDVVFLVGMEEGLFPHSQSLFEDGGLEEERRLCYVGITRAKKRLYLTNAKRRILYGKETFNPPSRFIDEIDKEYLDIVNPSLEEVKKIDKSQYYSDNNEEYIVGDIVMHQIYGRGTVVGVEDNFITIAFAKNYGIRKLLKSYKGLKKLN